MVQLIFKILNGSIRLICFALILAMTSCAPTTPSAANTQAPSADPSDGKWSEALLPIGDFAKVIYKLNIKNKSAFESFDETLAKFNIPKDSLYLNLESANFETDAPRRDNLPSLPTQPISPEEKITTKNGHKIVKRNELGKTISVLEYKKEELHLVKAYFYGRPGILTGINVTDVITNEKLIISIRFAEDERGNWTRRLVTLNREPLLEQQRIITYD